MSFIIRFVISASGRSLSSNISRLIFPFLIILTSLGCISNLLPWWRLWKSSLWSRSSLAWLCLNSRFLWWFLNSRLPSCEGFWAFSAFASLLITGLDLASSFCKSDIMLLKISQREFFGILIFKRWSTVTEAVSPVHLSESPIWLIWRPGLGILKKNWDEILGWKLVYDLQDVENNHRHYRGWVKTEFVSRWRNKETLCLVLSKPVCFFVFLEKQFLSTIIPCWPLCYWLIVFDLLGNKRKH